MHFVSRQDVAGSGHICSDYAPGELLEKHLTHAVHEHLFNETSSLAALPFCPQSYFGNTEYICSANQNMKHYKRDKREEYFGFGCGFTGHRFVSHPCFYSLVFLVCSVYLF